MLMSAPDATTGIRPYSRDWAQRHFPGYRVLLALEGAALQGDALELAWRCCRPLTRRLDILLTRPRLAPTVLLGGLLTRLERSGVDYRLTSAMGALAEEVEAYLQRFVGIQTLVLEQPATLPEATLNRLRSTGLQLITLSAAESGGELPDHRMSAQGADPHCRDWRSLI
jgi:hypothetical protein